MGFVRKLQLSSFQRTPLTFCTMFEARTIGSRMQCGIFQPDCKNLPKKIYEVGSQVQDLTFLINVTPMGVYYMNPVDLVMFFDLQVTALSSTLCAC